jgi:TonB family protein
MENPRVTRDLRRVRKIFTGAGVFAAHVLCLLLLLRQTSIAPGPIKPATNPPMIAALIQEPSAVTEESMKSLDAATRLETPVIEMSPPELAEFGVSDPDAASSAPLSGQFVPPRREDSAEALVKFASLASLRPGQMVRVILRVEVLPDGTTGVIAIDTASGFPSADAAAVEYARALRWSPASFGGVPTAMKVRLPVVFTGSG